MKAVIIFIFILTGMAVFAQEIPKGTSTIIVKGIFFQQVVKALFEAGYHIDKSDSVKIITLPREYEVAGGGQSKKIYNLIMTIRVIDSSAFITGQYNYKILENNILGSTSNNGNGKYIPVKNLESSTSLIRKSFNQMNEFAKSLQGIISYSKQ